MSTIFLQNTASTFVFSLTKLSNDTPITGVLYSAVTAQIKKATDSSFSAFAVTSSNWVEVGSGFYSITLTSSDTSVVGPLYLTITAATITPVILEAFIAAAITPPSPSPAPTVPGTTALSGFVLGIDGTPIAGAGVQFRLLGAPVSITGVGYAVAPMITKTDNAGHFSVILIEGISVDIRIPAINYSRTLVVPAADSNIFEIA